jgi:hypothetical protein
MAIFSKMAAMIMIKFESFVDTIARKKKFVGSILRKISVGAVGAQTFYVNAIAFILIIMLYFTEQQLILFPR